MEQKISGISGKKGFPFRVRKMRQKAFSSFWQQKRRAQRRILSSPPHFSAPGKRNRCVLIAQLRRSHPAG